MRLWILYNSRIFKNKSLSPEIMSEAARKQGFDAKVFYHDKFALIIEDNIQKLYYENQQVFDLPDLIFCRGYNNSLLQYFEKNGCAIINTANGMNKIINKYETHLELSSISEIKQPKTIMGSYSFNFVANQLKTPFIMKDNFGAKGERIFLINTEKEFLDIKNSNIETVFIFQEFIASSKGRDVRCYVVGDEIYPIMRQAGEPDEFRSNIFQGGYAEQVELSSEQLSLAFKIANLLSIEIGTVDFLFGENNELIFCEANGNASFKSYTDLNIDLRSKFVSYIEKKYRNYKNIIEQKSD